MKISLCMIVKNEAENLPRCLRSVEGIVDEIVVVDTGSVDGTPEVAARLGARVHRRHWNNDFAEARNASLDLATGDWVLYLDADEELIDGEALRSVSEDNEGYFLTIINFTGDELNSTGTVAAPSMRFFKNKREYRFACAIHEQIAAAVCKGGPVGWCKAKIHHYGYLHGAVASKDKVRRNLEILKRLAKEDPNDSFTRFNLGVEYMRLSRWEDALKEFKAAFPLLPAGLHTAYAPLMFKLMVLCLKELGRYSEALAILRDTEPAYPDYTDFTFVRGTVMLAAGCFSEAAEAFKECLEKGESGQQHITDVGVGGYRAYLGLGEALWKSGDLEGAAKAFLEAAKDESGNPAAICFLAELYLDAGIRPESVVQVLEGVVKNEAAKRALAGTFLKKRCPGAVLAMKGAVPLVRARAFWQKGEPEKTLAELAGQESAEAAWFRGVCLAVLSKKGDALKEFRKVRESLPGHADAGERFAAGKPLQGADPGALADLANLLLEGGIAREEVMSVLDPVAAGDIYRRAGMAAEAAGCYARALAGGKDLSPEALDFMAKAAKKTGFTEEALALALAAWKKAPSPARCARAVALLIETDDVRSAESVLKKGVLMYPYAEVLVKAEKALKLRKEMVS